MPDDCATQSVLFSGIGRRPVIAKFDQPEMSSDGGAILLRAAEARLGLTRALAEALQDRRQPQKVKHELVELIRQRVMSIACGYPDTNDAARLSSDPVHKLVVGRDPLAGADLASQSTLSRFENERDRKQLFRAVEALADQVIARHRKRLKRGVRRITVDLDPTDDATHGAQQLTFFNGHYDSYCYLPVLGFLTFDEEVDQYLVTAVLRPGNAAASAGALAILRRLLARLKRAFPEAVLRVRLDGGFATPDIFDFLDCEPKVEYLINMARNPVLLRKAEQDMCRARELSERSAESEHIYGECQYAARTWPWERRVIYKAEVVRAADKDAKDNPRFVVTNLKQSAQWVYEQVYCRRGDVENRIKELQDGMQIGRTSCSSFWANTFRVVLTAAAYILMQELRLHLAHTSSCRAQVPTLRERFLKVAARIVVSVRRTVLHLPRSFPDQSTFRLLATRLNTISL